MVIRSLLAFAAFAAVLTVTPGLDTVLVLRTTARQGRRAGAVGGAPRRAPHSARTPALHSGPTSSGRLPYRAHHEPAEPEGRRVLRVRTPAVPARRRGSAVGRDLAGSRPHAGRHRVALQAGGAVLARPADRRGFPRLRPAPRGGAPRCPLRYIRDRGCGDRRRARRALHPRGGPYAVTGGPTVHPGGAVHRVRQPPFAGVARRPVRRQGGGGQGSGRPGGPALA